MNQPNELYGSHLPLLARVLDLTGEDKRPVLELGMGLYSTPLMHTMCFLQEKRLISFDNDWEWFGENKKMKGKYHDVIFVDDWADPLYWDLIKDMHFSVAFVDHKPAKRRKEELKWLANRADFVIVHDTEPESDKYFKYSWIYKLYKYRYDYTSLRPHTSVLSNFIDVERLLK